MADYIKREDLPKRPVSALFHDYARGFHGRWIKEYMNGFCDGGRNYKLICPFCNYSYCDNHVGLINPSFLTTAQTAARRWTRGLTMRLIDADALGIGSAKREVFNDPQYADRWNSAIEIINNAPTVDAVPVVRCKDCESRITDPITGAKWCICNGGIREDSFFCGWGKRKDGGESRDD